MHPGKIWQGPEGVIGRVPEHNTGTADLALPQPMDCGVVALPKLHPDSELEAAELAQETSMESLASLLSLLHCCKGPDAC